MGFLTGGPFYDMIGRTGNNVGRRVKGRNVLSMRPSKSNKAPTLLQQIQREKWTAVVSWLRRLRGIVNVGFAAYDAQMSAMNAAIAYNLKNAVTLVAPYKVDYPEVLFSRGNLDLPNAPQIETSIAARIDYSWTANTGGTNALGTDKATFLVYNESKDKFVFLRAGALRSALGYNLLVPGDFSGDHVQVYISFESADGKLVSDSLYLGDHIVV
ncbi:hypothetical protein HDC92_003956 [Pedobacter sp. AK017]|uniref:DUF6266 family protein n=1 Tax=Pedobacter sp. AK017 TaxID=2723073 RepID=UPI0016153677|nr:DUF6266 family protein [Pedobacter sp. AK017]MBB5440256.1 hypothetical protein [Pedobacter sp. AK017]